MTRITQRVVFATAVLVVAVAGAAVAAGSITGTSIKDGTITGKDVKNHSLTKKDFRGSVRGPRGFRGATGPQGPAGPQGPQGTQGPAGLTRIVRTDGPTVSQGALGSGTEVQTSTATCPAGTFVTGGGFATGSIDDLVEYAKSGPTQYSVIAVNEFNQPGSITAHAVCAGGAGVRAASVRSHKTPRTVTRRAARLQAELNAR